MIAYLRGLAGTKSIRSVIRLGSCIGDCRTNVEVMATLRTVCSCRRSNSVIRPSAHAERRCEDYIPRLPEHASLFPKVQSIHGHLERYFGRTSPANCDNFAPESSHSDIAHACAKSNRGQKWPACIVATPGRGDPADFSHAACSETHLRVEISARSFRGGCQNFERRSSFVILLPRKLCQPFLDPDVLVGKILHLCFLDGKLKSTRRSTYAPDSSPSQLPPISQNLIFDC